jgi:hypothetical protein
MKMEKGLKEVYEGVKKLITISERIEGHTVDIDGIKGEIKEITGRLDLLETGQREIGADIRVIKEKMELKDEIYAIKERLTLVEGAQQARASKA